MRFSSSRMFPGHSQVFNAFIKTPVQNGGGPVRPQTTPTKVRKRLITRRALEKSVRKMP
jgi:hypothetical protein